MKLTTRSEYALLALVYLARQGGESFIPIDEIATAQRIPSKFLEQLMLALKRNKYLYSQRGQKGGYRLAKPASEISLAVRPFKSVSKAVKSFLISLLSALI